MDKEAGVVSQVSVMPSEESHRRNLPAPNGVAAYRGSLVEAYHDGAPSLIERLKRTGNDDAQSMVVSLIDEVIKETDNLLGNQLVATENGELRDASVISFKRAEVLEKAIKAVQSKRQFEQESGLDIDSPAMMVVFRFFMSKTKDVFQRMEMADEQIDLFFTSLSEEMENWKKELREEFETLKAR